MATRRPVNRVFIDTDNDRASQGFLELLASLFLSPRQFFRRLNGVKPTNTLLLALLILLLLSFSSIQQAAPLSTTDMEVPPMEGEFSSAPAVDPSQKWMTGLTAAGEQVVFWLILTVVLSEVSLFNGKAPQFGKNLNIAIWASLPFGLMALVQILFLAGGGTVGQAGFTGFLDEWPEYSQMNAYAQSVIFAFASQINLFSIWSCILLYLGARESLKGKRWSVGFALGMWLFLLIMGLGFRNYQQLNLPFLNDENYAGYSDELMPPDETSTEETDFETEDGDY